MILNFPTDRSGQTVQTQIRLLLEEQSDQGLHCLLFHLHVFDKIPSVLASLFEFQVNNSKVSCVRKFRMFTVLTLSVTLGSLLSCCICIFSMCMMDSFLCIVICKSLTCCSIRPASPVCLVFSCFTFRCRFF